MHQCRTNITIGMDAMVTQWQPTAPQQEKVLSQHQSSAGALLNLTAALAVPLTN